LNVNTGFLFKALDGVIEYNFILVSEGASHGHDCSLILPGIGIGQFLPLG